MKYDTYDRYRFLAALIAAHPQREVVGRTRLQKTVKLLQRLDFPTDYHFTIHFYGPYSEGLQAEINLLEQMKVFEEQKQSSQEDRQYFVLSIKSDVKLPDISRFEKVIETLANSKPVELELAATYDTFREIGMEHETALLALRAKKGKKCDNHNDVRALELLGKIGLAAH